MCNLVKETGIGFKIRFFLGRCNIYISNIFAEPRFFFEKAKYVIDESADFCEIVVKRFGSDLSQPSSVIVKSRKTNPLSAQGVYFYMYRASLTWMDVQYL